MNEVTICLSGGGARGLAHIGVFKYLTEAGIKIKALSGTSAGALVGAFICDGFQPEEIIEIIKTQLKSPSYNYWNLNKGLVSVDFFNSILVKNLRAQLIEQLQIPFFANATNYITGEMKLFEAGPIVPAIMASSAIPIVFPPVLIDNVPYVDGGLYCNLNTQPLKKFEKKIVGVHVNPLTPYNPSDRIDLQIDRLFKLSIRIGAVSNISECDIFIEPEQLEKFDILEVKSFDKIIEIGYNSAVEVFKHIHQNSLDIP